MEPTPAARTPALLSTAGKTVWGWGVNGRGSGLSQEIQGSSLPGLYRGLSGATLTQGRGSPDTRISGHTWEDHSRPWALMAPGRSFLTGWANGLASGTEPYGSLGKGRRLPWVDGA